MIYFTKFVHYNRFGRHLKSYEVVKGMVENLPALIPANSVDYVVCTYVLCSVKDVQEALRNIHYVLKPVT